MKKFFTILFTLLLISCSGNYSKISTELFGIKIYDDIKNYLNINVDKISRTGSKKTLFLNTEKNSFNGLDKNLNLDAYQLKVNEKNKILTITGLKNFGEISNKNFKDRCEIESNNFKTILAKQYNKDIDQFTQHYYKDSNAMGRDYLFFSNELRFNKDSKKLIIQIMCSYTNIDNYVHSTIYVSLIDQNYWLENTLQTFKN
tara:strand:- start:170 stop:772 length:603 start_codon:yes stop_codon:yes gene_type:complete